jgi:hypothetical protein
MHPVDTVELAVLAGLEQLADRVVQASAVVVAVE